MSSTAASSTTSEPAVENQPVKKKRPYIMTPGRKAAMERCAAARKASIELKKQLKAEGKITEEKSSRHREVEKKRHKHREPEPSSDSESDIQSYQESVKSDDSAEEWRQVYKHHKQEAKKRESFTKVHEEPTPKPKLLFI
jgi:hypothetical protein